MRHGGRIEGDKYKSYVGGEVDYFDLCDGDRMTMQEINGMVKRYDYNNEVIFYYYLDPRNDINHGLKEFQTNKHIREFYSWAEWFKLMEVIGDHVPQE